MTTATLEPTKRWECWECTALPSDHPDRANCICKVNRPTPMIAILLEPMPSDLRVQASMLSAKLRMGREQVHSASENARFEEKYDRIEAGRLRDDARRWQLRVDRIEAEFRRVQAELNTGSEKTNKPAPAKKHGSNAPRAGRKSARAPRSRAAKPSKAAAKKATGSRTGHPASSDAPASGEPAPAPFDPDPARPATAAERTIAVQKKPLLERTREFWQRRTGKALSLEDAREILETSVGYVRLLNAWAKKHAEKSAGPTNVAEGTDTSASAAGEAS